MQVITLGPSLLIRFFIEYLYSAEYPMRVFYDLNLFMDYLASIQYETNNSINYVR